MLTCCEPVVSRQFKIDTRPQYVTGLTLPKPGTPPTVAHIITLTTDIVCPVLVWLRHNINHLPNLPSNLNMMTTVFYVIMLIRLKKIRFQVNIIKMFIREPKQQHTQIFNKREKR